MLQERNSPSSHIEASCDFGYTTPSSNGNRRSIEHSFARTCKPLHLVTRWDDDPRTGELHAARRYIYACNQVLGVTIFERRVERSLVRAATWWTPRNHYFESWDRVNFVEDDFD